MLSKGRESLLVPLICRLINEARFAREEGFNHGCIKRNRFFCSTHNPPQHFNLPLSSHKQVTNATLLLIFRRWPRAKWLNIVISPINKIFFFVFSFPPISTNTEGGVSSCGNSIKRYFWVNNKKGYACAERFADEGCNLHLVARYSTAVYIKKKKKHTHTTTRRNAHTTHQDLNKRIIVLSCFDFLFFVGIEIKAHINIYCVCLAHTKKKNKPRTKADLEAAKTKIESRYGVECVIHAVDLSVGDNVRALFQAVPPIDVLVNNAGE